jgi:hypothetical protein
VTSFYFLRHSKEGKKINTLQVKLVVLLIDLILWLIFAMIVVLIAYYSDEPEVETGCECRIQHEEKLSEEPRLIRIIYRFIIAGICFGIAIFIMLWGKKISNEESSMLLKFVISLFLCANSIAFAIYFLVDEPSVYFVFVLWFTELIPVLFLAWRLSPKSGYIAHLLNSNLSSTYHGQSGTV